MLTTYGKVKDKIQSKIDAAQWISFTTDIWSSPSNHVSLISFTAHFIDAGKRSKVILAASAMEEDHNAQNISDKLINVIDEFKISDRIHLGVRDNARNMNAALRIANVDHFGCVSHTLQLVIHDAIDKNASIKTLIKKCRSIVGFFKRSDHGYRHLQVLQERCGVPKHTLLQDIETRWNSTYIMWERLLEQRAPVTLYAAEKGGIPLLIDEDWKNIAQIISCLENLYEATLDICSDDSCVSIIIPLIQLLKYNLNDADITTGFINDFRKDLKSSLCERFGYLTTSIFSMVATLLDPRFKNKYLNEQEVSQNIYISF